MSELSDAVLSELLTTYGSPPPPPCPVCGAPTKASYVDSDGAMVYLCDPSDWVPGEGFVLKPGRESCDLHLVQSRVIRNELRDERVTALVQEVRQARQTGFLATSEELLVRLARLRAGLAPEWVQEALHMVLVEHHLDSLTLACACAKIEAMALAIPEVAPFVADFRYLYLASEELRDQARQRLRLGSLAF